MPIHYPPWIINARRHVATNYYFSESTLRQKQGKMYCTVRRLLILIMRYLFLYSFSVVVFLLHRAKNVVLVTLGTV